MLLPIAASGCALLPMVASCPRWLQEVVSRLKVFASGCMLLQVVVVMSLWLQVVVRCIARGSKLSKVITIGKCKQKVASGELILSLVVGCTKWSPAIASGCKLLPVVASGCQWLQGVGS